MRTKLLLFKAPASPKSPPYIEAFSDSDSITEDMVSSAEKIINKYGTLYSSLFPSPASSQSGDRDARRFFSAVSDLQVAMKFLVSTNPSSSLIVRAHGAVQAAMNKLEREILSILKSNRDVLDPGSIVVSSSSSKQQVVLEIGNWFEEHKDSDHYDDFRRKRAMDDLKLIADCMLSCGYGTECVKIFKEARKSIVKEKALITSTNTGSGELHRNKPDWEELDRSTMNNWLTSFEYAVKSVFSGERIFCDHVFSSAPSIRELCFSEINGDVALSLLEFPQSVANSNKSLEKLFQFLDLYESISRNSLDIRSIFSFESSSTVRLKVDNSLSKLGEAVRSSLDEFESAIQKNNNKKQKQKQKKDSSSSKFAVPPGGGVHPLTRYVMNYLSLLAEYSHALEDAFADWPLNLRVPLPQEQLSHRRNNHDDDDDEELSADRRGRRNVSDRFAWLILVLLCKLDRNVELYRDVSLSYLFLANNLRYVVDKVESSEIRSIVGEAWVSVHEEKVRKYVSSYKRVGWSRVLSALDSRSFDHDDGDGDGDRDGDGDEEEEEETSSVSAAAKEIFLRFNKEFMEVYRKQVGWVVANQGMGEEIRSSIRKKIVPKYRVIYKRYRHTVTSTGTGTDIVVGHHDECVVKFAPQDLDKYISGLFSGDSSDFGASAASSSSSSMSSPCSDDGRRCIDGTTTSSWYTGTKVCPVLSAIGSR